MDADLQAQISADDERVLAATSSAASTDPATGPHTLPLHKGPRQPSETSPTSVLARLQARIAEDDRRILAATSGIATGPACLWPVQRAGTSLANAQSGPSAHATSPAAASSASQQAPTMAVGHRAQLALGEPVIGPSFTSAFPTGTLAKPGQAPQTCVATREEGTTLQQALFDALQVAPALSRNRAPCCSMPDGAPLSLVPEGAAVGDSGDPHHGCAEPIAGQLHFGVLMAPGQAVQEPQWLKRQKDTDAALQARIQAADVAMCRAFASD
jgi:hypothetical protein